MRLPTVEGNDALRIVVRHNLSTYTFERPNTATDDGPYAPSDGTTTVDRDVWLFDPTEVNDQTPFGERIEGSLGGLTLPSTDVQRGDRVTYSGVDYEVEEVTEMTDDGTELQMLSLVRITNDA